MLQTLLDPVHLLTAFGYIGLATILFAESGLLVGFFLPGDTLLITAGILASQGYLNILLVLLVSLLAAIVGDNVGYYFGVKVGTKLFRRQDSRLFSQKRITESHVFFEKYGIQSIILARFVPVVRTFTPIIAGTSKMSYRKFALYNVIGGILWTVGVTLLGFGLGRVVPNIDAYILPVIIFISVVSVLPAVWHLFRQRTVKS